MIYQLVVPGPIEDVDEVRVLEWHGAEGSAFEAGSLLVELETHKAVVDVRTAQKGFLRRILRQEGEWQKTGQPLALWSDTAAEALVEEGPLEPLPVEFEIA